jgi:transcriptional regulator with XRE-family HTH domain
MPSVEQLKRLGDLVREARKSKSWTLDETALNSGVGRSWVSNIERAYVNPKRGPVTPSDDVLYRLSKSLDIPFESMHVALGRVEGDELDREPFIDELKQAGYLDHLPAATKDEIMDYIRFKAEQAIAGAKTTPK